MNKNEEQIVEKSKVTFKKAQQDWVKVKVKDGSSPYPHSSMKRIAKTIKDDDIVDLFISPKNHHITIRISSKNGETNQHFVYLNKRTWAELYHYFKPI